MTPEKILNAKIKVHSDYGNLTIPVSEFMDIETAADIAEEWNGDDWEIIDYGYDYLTNILRFEVEW